MKKICLFGTESVGKSTMMLHLMEHFNTIGVPEMAREIIEGVENCTMQHLYEILDLHSQTILDFEPKANKVLFIDTDIYITNSYSNYLFGTDLFFEDWHLQANTFDLYLYLDKNVPHIQDSTRLNLEERNKLDVLHAQQLIKNNLPYVVLSGNYEERLEQAIEETNKILRGK